MATTSRRRARTIHSPPPLDVPPSESKAIQGALLPQRSTDCTPRAETIAAVAVFSLALIVRLWKIPYPASVVFDEVHFLRFVKNYHDGRYLFDIHPPLGKLILLLISKIFCGNPARELKSNGVAFGDISYVPLRVTSALFGAATSPVMLLIGRELGLSLPASILPAFAHALDNLSVVEGRVVVMDAQLTFFMAGALMASLKLFGCSPRDARRRMQLLIATALLSAAAVSVKWTTAVTPLLIAIVSLVGFPFMCTRLKFLEMALAGTLAISLYIACFAVHFSLLPNAGDGDGFMPVSFQSTLRNNSHYKPGARGPGFVRNLVWLNGEMYRANARIKTRHHWESKWYQWVVNQRGLLYFDEAVGGGKRSRIYLIVNPAVSVAALFAVVGTIAVLLGVYLPTRMDRRAGRRMTSYDKLHGFAARAGFLLAGYFLNLVPYLGKFSPCSALLWCFVLVFSSSNIHLPYPFYLSCATEVSRCTFLYHYIPPLFYAELLLANLVNLAPPKLRWRLCVGLSAFMFVAFLYWAPWIYGSPLSAEGHRRRRLFGKHWE